jgi:hypothetical protein
MYTVITAVHFSASGLQEIENFEMEGKLHHNFSTTCSLKCKLLIECLHSLPRSSWIGKSWDFPMSFSGLDWSMKMKESVHYTLVHHDLHCMLVHLACSATSVQLYRYYNVHVRSLQWAFVRQIANPSFLFPGFWTRTSGPGLPITACLKRHRSQPLSLDSLTLVMRAQTSNP